MDRRLNGTRPSGDAVTPGDMPPPIPFELPEAESAEDWEPFWDEAGFDDDTPQLQVRVELTNNYQLVVHHLGKDPLVASVTRPDTPQERAKIVWLAASMVDRLASLEVASPVTAPLTFWLALETGSAIRPAEAVFIEHGLAIGFAHKAGFFAGATAASRWTAGSLHTIDHRCTDAHVGAQVGYKSSGPVGGIVEVGGGPTFRRCVVRSVVSPGWVPTVNTAGGVTFALGSEWTLMVKAKLSVDVARLTLGEEDPLIPATVGLALSVRWDQ